MSLTDRREHAGGAAPTTTAGVTLASATTISIANGTGWPTGAIGDFFVTLARGTANEERVLCTSRTGNVLTVAGSGRGADSTVAREHQDATVIEHTWSTVEADEASAHSSSLSGHGVDEVVGVAETQTLENKTLEEPIINAPDITGGTITGIALSVTNFTNAQHDHGDADDGGNIPIAAVTNLESTFSDIEVAVGTIGASLQDDVLDAKGQPNGYASLDGSGDVPIAQVPTGTSGTTVSLGNHTHSTVPIDFAALPFSGVKAIRDSNQVIGDAATENVQFTGTSVWDTDSYKTNSTTFTLPATGDYEILVNNNWEGHATGRRTTDIRLNDTSSDGSAGVSIGKENPEPGHSASFAQNVRGYARVTGTTNTIKVCVFQNRGGNLSLLSSDQYGTSIIIRRVR